MLPKICLNQIYIYIYIYRERERERERVFGIKYHTSVDMQLSKRIIRLSYLNGYVLAKILLCCAILFVWFGFGFFV